VIVAFADGQVLDFANVDDAKAFLYFYHRSPLEKLGIPGRSIYCRAKCGSKKTLDNIVAAFDGSRRSPKKRRENAS